VCPAWFPSPRNHLGQNQCDIVLAGSSHRSLKQAVQKDLRVLPDIRANKALEAIESERAAIIACSFHQAIGVEEHEIAGLQRVLDAAVRGAWKGSQHEPILSKLDQFALSALPQQGWRVAGTRIAYGAVAQIDVRTSRGHEMPVERFSQHSVD